MCIRDSSPAPGVSPEEAGPWLRAAWRILAWALREEGVGAKTSSGYGRMALEEPASQGEKPLAPGPSPVLQDLLTWARALSYREVPRFLASQAEAILGLSVEEAQALRRALEERGFLRNPQDLKRWRKEHPGLEGVLAKLGLSA